MNINWNIVAIIVSFAGFLTAFYLYTWVRKQPGGNREIEDIGTLIKNGSRTFLKREYTVLTRFVAAAALLIFLFLPHPIWLTQEPFRNIITSVSYILGSVLSGIAGIIGMNIATVANVKSAVAAKKGIGPAFSIGFRGGAVMGMAVVSTSLLGAAVLYLVTGDSNALLGFSFGASSLALFAKAGGGIFTKTADVSADLAGKLELNIPEDDPRNPAVIADNVGDNVGDVAGMGADLFDSNIASMTAAIVIGAALNQEFLIFCYGSIGLLASIIGVLSAKIGKDNNPGKALNKSTYITTAAFAVLTAVISMAAGYSMRIWGATIVGLFVGVIIGITSEYFTSDEKKPVKNVAKASNSGPAFTIISGFSYGLISALPALIGIGTAALAAYKICDPLGPGYAMFGISMAAMGMLSIAGMIISNDAYGPIVDNSRGLAEMTGMGENILKITDELDSAGNTVKAVTKGFSIAAAGLTVIALLAAYQEIVRDATGEMIRFDAMNPVVFFGILAGVAIPAIFSAMLMLGVDKNAQRMIGEIHRQFNSIEGLKEGRKGVKPDYDKCIDIATIGALKELMPAGAVTILSTLVVGFIGGIHAIGGFLLGNIMSGLLLALVMSNAGGCWDNSKKYIEAGAYGGKGSNAHKSAVIGDTVGDPFKDTAGPSINTQITVVSLVASLAATLFIKLSVF